MSEKVCSNVWKIVLGIFSRRTDHFIILISNTNISSPLPSLIFATNITINILLTFINISTTTTSITFTANVYDLGHNGIIKLIILIIITIVKIIITINIINKNSSIDSSSTQQVQRL